MDSGLTGEDKVVHDYPLYHMADGVVRHPTGRQAQMLTRVIDHVRNVTGDRNVLLSQGAAYAQRYDITVPAHEQLSNDIDVEDSPPAALLASIRADYHRKHQRHP
jgi:hypothetical protein